MLCRVRGKAGFRANLSRRQQTQMNFMPRKKVVWQMEKLVLEVGRENGREIFEMKVK